MVEDRVSFQVNKPDLSEGQLTLAGGSTLPAGLCAMVRHLKLQSPAQGFGGLVLRTYRVRLPGSNLTPQQIFTAWKAGFADCWPRGNYFLPATEHIETGTLAVILLSMPLGMRVVTAASVIYDDETSFTLSTLQGHMFAGWITFSAFLEEGVPVIQVQALIRPGDPLYHLVFLLGIGPAAEDRFWRAVLSNFARSLGHDPAVEQVNRTIDPSIQWRYFGNIWYNAGIRSFPRFFGRSFERMLHRQGPY